MQWKPLDKSYNPCYSVIELFSVRKYRAMAGSVIVGCVDRLPSAPQRELKLARHLYVRESRPSINWTIGGAMQHQDWHLYLGGSSSHVGMVP